MIGWLRGFLPQGPGAALWLALGLAGQTMFAGRWLVQWLASERRKESVIPPVFWWLSLVGGLMVLAYGIHRRDPVLVVGQWGVLVYARNLVLLQRVRDQIERRRDEA